ncbi:MBL fold metallo-hydrolase [Kitasatospora sp. NPDC097605]|uniref:MBL fold metallo-hydrolase n=1 Tax=Kitasatospora sp. NPDC097605 TaxID=3157226 RepID=UPI0033244B7B
MEPVPAYPVRRPEGLLLLDTGLGEGDPEADAHYRPVRRPLTAAPAAAGAAPGDVDVVVNCHLHFDHCGGNPLLAGVPVWTQAAEPARARAGGYTIDALVDFPGVRDRELDGEAEVWPGVRVVPTPGHTAGHQSLTVAGPDGCTVPAGQAYDTASAYGAAVPARRAAREGVVGAPGCPGTRLGRSGRRRPVRAGCCSRTTTRSGSRPSRCERAQAGAGRVREAQKVKRSERIRWSKLDGTKSGSPRERTSGSRVNSSR